MNREEAIKHLSEWMDEKMWRCFGTIDREAIGMAIEALSDRPKGAWKCMADCGVTECDQCGWTVEEYVGDYNYCPNCGAIMYKGGDTK